MPGTVNGIGTSVCFGRGSVKWNGLGTGDAMECFVVLFMPVIPYKAMHVFNWTGTNYNAIPIRWSGSLLFRTFALYWMAIPLVVGLVAAVVGGINGFSHGFSPGYLTALLGGLGAVLACVLGYWALLSVDRRTRDIRRVYGPHQFGASDPTTWTDDLLKCVAEPKELFNADSYAAAATALLEKKDYASAMWAARLSTALENQSAGEALTDAILTHPDVAEAVRQVRRNPDQWSQVMFPHDSKGNGS
jgi:hypothetical protein